MGYTYTEKIVIVYLKFKLSWVYCIFISRREKTNLKDSYYRSFMIKFSHSYQQLLPLPHHLPRLTKSSRKLYTLHHVHGLFLPKLRDVH